MPSLLSVLTNTLPIANAGNAERISTIGNRPGSTHIYAKSTEMQ